jgi:hypothetical protein
MRVKLQTRFKKHAHLLVFVGASVVFFTFVAKEGLAEHWNHIAESIDKAEITYSTQKKLTDLERSMTYFRFLIVLQINLEKTHKQSSYTAEEMRRETSLMDRIDDELINLNILEDVLSEDDANRRASEALRRDYRAASVKLKSIQGTWGTLLSSDEKDEYEPNMAIMQALAASSSGDLAQRVDTLINKTLSDARERKKRNARFSKWAWWISTALFTLGTGLGLLGKLYGVPEAAGGE